MSTNFYERVAQVQATLHAPKGQYNDFGGYKYRNCEDILESVKPLLGGLVITISDEMVAVGDRIYVKATATITDGENSLSNTAFAREPLSKKGMDESQITGAASSYARKYCLNGLLLIDDTKDADSMDNRDQGRKPQQQPRQPSRQQPRHQPEKPPVNWDQGEQVDTGKIQLLNNAPTLDALANIWKTQLTEGERKAFLNVKEARKKQLSQAAA